MDVREADRVTRLMAKLDWDAFRTAAAKVSAVMECIGPRV